MSTTNFPSPVNGAESALAVDYTAGSGTMTLAEGYGAVINQKLAQLGLPSISASSPLPYTITSNVYPTYGSAIYRATGLSGDELTGVFVAEGTADQFFGAGSAFNVYPTAGQIAQMQSAIIVLESTQPSIIAAPYITQTPVSALPGSQALSTLATGLMKSTTGTGVLSTAIPAVDYPGLAIANTFTAPQTLPVQDKAGQVFNVLAYGAKSDIQSLAGSGIAVGATSVTVPSYVANSGDVGKTIEITGAAAFGFVLTTTITSVADGIIHFTTPTTTLVSSPQVTFYTDDTTVIRSAIAAASAAGGGIVYCPPGTYVTSSPLAVPSYVIIRGAGNATIFLPSLGWANGGNHAVFEMIGNSGLIKAAGLQDLLINVRCNPTTLGVGRDTLNLISFMIILSNAEGCLFENVVFRAHGYGQLPANLPSDPCVLIIAKDVASDVGPNYPPTVSTYTTAVVGPSQFHTIRNCRFEGTGTTQFAIRVLTDWTSRRAPLAFTNYAEGNVFDANTFTGSYGWNVLEIAGGGSRQNSVVNNRYKGVQATLTCIDFDKGCNYNIAIGNHIEGATKPSYYISNPDTRLVVIDDHGIPASDNTGAGGAYYSEANRVIGNTIGPIDTPASSDVLESAIGITASIRSLIMGNAITSVNLTNGIGSGIVFSECSQATISHNNVAGVAVGIRSDGSVTSRYLMKIVENEIQATNSCINFSGTRVASGNLSRGVTISGNTCYTSGTTQSVIFVGAELNAPSIVNNQCFGGSEGVNVSASEAIIANNNCRDNSLTAIRIYSGAVITGNQDGNTPNDVLFSGTASSNTPLFLSGNHFAPIKSVATTATFALSTELLECDATAGPFTVTLPDAQLLPAQICRAVKIDASGNAITVATVSGQTISGAATATIGTQWEVGVFTSDGSNWIQQ